MSSMVRRLGEPGFAQGLLQDLEPVLPAASWSVYRTGHRCKPTLFMSASQGVPDTTQDCWWAYLAGPYRSDRTWGRMFDDIHVIVPETRLCHVTAKEVDGEHRARVYEAHGMAERVSVVEYESTGSVFAVNFYRHQHQLPFSDRQIGEFESVAPVLLELARKLKPAFLLIDVLELAEAQDMPHLRRSMQGLHDGGIRFAMSVEDLERPYAQFLPFDVIRMNVQEYSREKWQLWQEEAQVHNLPLLAYRVEAESQVHALSQKLVDYLQGFAVRDVMTLEMPRYQL